MTATRSGPEAFVCVVDELRRDVRVARDVLAGRYTHNGTTLSLGLPPDWLAGGTLIAQGLVLPWSRIAVVGFVILVAAGVWFILQRTRLGLQVRAVTQNRAMA